MFSATPTVPNHTHCTHMSPEVDLADVVVLQHGAVASVGGEVGGTVVDGTPGGEGQA